MHITTVTTKTEEVYQGILWKFRPEENYFELGDKRFSFDEVASVITEGERLPGGKIGDMDEIERARQHLIDGRKYGWFDIPVMDWEVDAT